MPFEVPPLPYDYNALEPHIDEQTMRLHHDKHHQAYVDNANKALDGTEWADIAGAKQPWGTIAFDLSAIVSSTPIDDWKPTSEEFEGYTGKRRRAEEAPERHGCQAVRLRLELAGPRRDGAGRLLDGEPGLADLELRHAAPRDRRVGARLLPQVPEQASGVSGGLVERRQLGRRSAEVRERGLSPRSR